MPKRGTRRAVIYARISDDRDGKGAGVARQLAACRELAARDGLEVVAELVDNSRSASSYARQPRPAWRDLLGMLERGEVDYLIAWATDRLYRQVLDLEHLIPLLDEAGAEVRTASSGRFDLSTPEGRLYARMTAAVGAHESERKSERIRARYLEDAKAGKASSGGARAYGYSRDGLTLIPHEADVIRKGIDRVLAGDSLTAIAKSWNAEGIPTSTGGAWRMGTLKRTLTRWRNAAVREHYEELYPAEWPAIVDRATLERVRAVLMDPARSVTIASPRVAPLRGLMRCGLCGELMITGSASSRKSEGRVRTYRCGRPPQNRGCGRLVVRARPVEAEVFERVAAVLAGEGLTAALQRVSGGVAGKDSSAAELVAARQRLEQLSDDYYTLGRLKRGEYERRRADLERMIVDLERTLSAPQSTSLLTRLPSDPDGIAKALADLPPATAYALLRLVVARIVVAPGKPGTFDPERVRIDWAA